MSSNEESDDEFQSADEDIEFEPNFKHELENKNNDSEDLKTQTSDNDQKSDQLLQQFDNQMKITSIESKENKSIDSIEDIEKCEKSSEVWVETRKQTKSVDIKPEDNKFDDRNEKTSEKIIDNSGENKTKEVIAIKTRKILRKGDRRREQINAEEEADVKDIEPIVLIEEKEKHEICSEPPKEVLETPIKPENEKIDSITVDNNTELVSKETVVEKVEENETKEVKTVIKGRKLLRKADRLREQTNTEESEISEEKKTEVLNKLSLLSEKEDSSSKWNNWFTDIKSAAITATSTTASHVSQASNKWSLNPKSLLTSAVSITSNVGSGISSVVENVSSVMDSAIGAPPPEQMAALHNKQSKVEETLESDKQNTEKIENQNKSSLGFGLFDYTLNTLESIGKKTMEVIVDDKQKSDKTHKKD